MSTNRVIVPTCPSIVLHRCHGCGEAAEPAARQRTNARPLRPQRPAWQSPYGPPQHRAPRGRWVPVPGLADSPAALRRALLCARCG